MSPKKITFISGKNKLVGNLFTPQENHKQTGLLLLHGGGESSKERFIKLQEMFFEEGYPSLAIDFQGVGESEGEFEQGTLLQRINDAQAGFHELKKYVDEVIVVGFSMGGHVAVQLTEKVDIFALILFYPGAYAKEAEDLLLNETFTKVLRTPNSWENSPVFTTLQNYQGKTLILYGEKDCVIPQEVQTRFKESLGQNAKYVLIPYATHAMLMPQTDDQRQAKNRALHEVQEFLMQNTLIDKINIRTWKDSDFENAVTLNREADEFIGMKSENGDWAKDMEGITEVFLQGGGGFLVGFFNNKLVVMGGYKRLPNNQVEIKRMRVSPQLQGKGIGKWFLKLLENKAIQDGITIATVSTTSKQAGALRLYTGAGYQEVGRRLEDRGPDKGLIIISFTKKLA